MPLAGAGHLAPVNWAGKSSFLFIYDCRRYGRTSEYFQPAVNELSLRSVCFCWCFLMRRLTFHSNPLPWNDGAEPCTRAHVSEGGRSLCHDVIVKITVKSVPVVYCCATSHPARHWFICWQFMLLMNLQSGGTFVDTAHLCSLGNSGVLEWSGSPLVVVTQTSWSMGRPTCSALNTWVPKPLLSISVWPCHRVPQHGGLGDLGISHGGWRLLCVCPNRESQVDTTLPSVTRPQK